MDKAKDIVLAFDTANEVIAIGVGCLDRHTRRVQLLCERRVSAHRASNTQLLPQIDDLLTEHGIERDRIACVVCGRGPGSFTGVRICMATAKGIASALEVALVGVSTLDAVAWGVWQNGNRGALLVLADAMRKEVYPALFSLEEDGPVRINADTVMKAQAARALVESYAHDDALLLAGDGLEKYADSFADIAGVALADDETWAATGCGLLMCLQAAWNTDVADPFDARRHDPALLLPVYTRLSDAEENERTRLSDGNVLPRNLTTGVQNKKGSAVEFRPLDAAHMEAVAQMEQDAMGSDAWNTALVADELPRADRAWWMALSDGRLVGYAGGWVVDGQVHILKVAVDEGFRRRGIAQELLARVADDARNLGAMEATLEVRVSNEGAVAFYERLGLKHIGVRPHYYSDGEDACIMTGPLPTQLHDVAGMQLQTDAAATDCVSYEAPLILAIETSCDETAAAIIDGTGTVLADTVASQIDFHARFGGVVPEIASRKHIEAICGVTQVCLEHAARKVGAAHLRWSDLDAVAVTYAPGLVGALVVGVAFAKGAAWGARKPFIGVNHLEGHLYANRLAAADMQPPMVASLVSGGHTMLVHVRAWGNYEILGSTVDDAVGEAFDKVAKALGLGYPGGPVISELARQGNADAIHFPRAMLHSGDLQFSLSGLKTAVITYIHQHEQAAEPLNVADVAAAFQAAVVDVQVAKAASALDATGAREFCLGGGVAANPVLRRAYREMCAARGVRLSMPPLSACGDNAAMIALVACDRFRQKRFFGLDADACAHTNLEEPY